MEPISILGCGWLGLPLAKALLKNGFLINGSTTSGEKLSILKSYGIHPFLVTLSAVEGANSENEIHSFLANSEILIIDIPPSLRGKDSSTALGKTFVKKIQNLIPFIEKSTVEKVLFVSATSVYADDNTEITENTIPNPDTESGKQLWEAEQLLQNNSNFKTTVVRFGGLIGENRHPIHFLAGKQNLENPEAPINLIHQEDCIGIIEKIIAANFWNETLNVVAPFHPTRITYYTQKAIELNLALPEFDESKSSVGKTILSEKTEHVLGYTFQNKTL